ncbi:hypothetical protein JIN84_21985 [Luteolibacter yonseiensis]|uniref:Uncharacterized protein n=2 Tax=Luteolibacter yonseiensis TaxID=1144680 RepID=A0A934R6Q8_9BACT|nr:hypothetical protein [Luteolibacter yonseiensis]MBK1818306.1 hypothetical protein [Luteolibacter yonseiensis]
MARLAPPALSAEFKSGLDETIDKLAAAKPENVTEISSGKWLVRSLIGGGIAAGIGAMFALFPADHTTGPSMAKAEDAPSGSVLVSASERLESVTDVGMRKDFEGTEMHAVKFTAVRENNVRDEESGMVVKISQPREEILMMPVGEFDLKRPFQSGMVEAAALPEDNNGPLRVVNVAEKSAEFTFQGEGKATVTREADQYQVKIRGTADDVIFDGGLAKDALLDAVPEPWRKRVLVLCRTLDSALDGNLMSPREPKPRQAPPAPRGH